jgi:hypothetical protein
VTGASQDPDAGQASLPDDPPVSVIREIRVRLGAEPEFEVLMGRLIAAAQQAPGHRRSVRE